jgi:hypothetical protein
MKKNDPDLLKTDIKKDKEKLEVIDDSVRNMNNLLVDISNLWKNRKNMSESAKDMWISDAKEAYYQLYASYENLSACITTPDKKSKVTNAESSKHFLSGAESGIKQSLSELNALEDVKAKEIARKWQKTFIECKTQIEGILQGYLAQREIKPPESPIIQINNEEFHILCALCGDPAVIIKIGKKWYTQGTAIIYEGITKSTSLHINTAPEILALLKQKKVKELHKFLIQNLAFEGMDAYCPECDKVYCRNHYVTEEEWDDGFYDCTYGTCQNGHRRMIDD